MMSRLGVCRHRSPIRQLGGGGDHNNSSDISKSQGELMKIGLGLDPHLPVLVSQYQQGVGPEVSSWR